jgi:hypothetical protein
MSVSVNMTVTVTVTVSMLMNVTVTVTVTLTVTVKVTFLPFHTRNVDPKSLLGMALYLYFKKIKCKLNGHFTVKRKIL